MKGKVLATIGMLIASALMLAACAAPVVPTSVPVAPTSAPTSITVTDSAGRQVTLPSTPMRLISLAPSTTEIVFALGFGDRLVGTDTFSDYPPPAKEIPRISDGFNPNYEQIIAAKPDLVLAAGITSPDVIKKLEELKIPVLVIGAANTSIEGVMGEIKIVGKALRAESQAEQVVNGMASRLEDLKAKIGKATTKPRVYWELDATDPAKPFAPGPGSFVNDLIALAGGENVTASGKSPYSQINAEEVIKANPEIIILSDAAYGITPESVGKRPGWDVILAVKNGKVFPIDDNLVSRPGPRLIEGLEAAARLIHPELFE